MEQYVEDIELTVPDRKPDETGVPRAIPVPCITKGQRQSGHHGKCTVRKVSKKEMKKLWGK